MKKKKKHYNDPLPPKIYDTKVPLAVSKGLSKFGFFYYITYVISIFKRVNSGYFEYLCRYTLNGNDFRRTDKISSHNFLIKKNPYTIRFIIP